MPRVNKSVASTDRYKNGRYVEDKKTKSGKRLDYSQPRDEKDTLFCKKGDTYYWWQFKDSPKQFSLEYPSQKELTKSAYLKTVYGINESIESCRSSISSADDVESFLDNIKIDIESLKDETESSLQSMPEHLQEFSILNERIQNLEEAYNDLDSIDTDYEELNRDDVIEDVKIDKGWDDDLDDDDEDQPCSMSEIEALADQKIQEHLEEWIEEKCAEIEAIQIQC